MAGMNHRRREAQSHSLALTAEQERVSRAPYDTRDTYRWRICKQYVHYNAQTGSIKILSNDIYLPNKSCISIY